MSQNEMESRLNALEREIKVLKSKFEKIEKEKEKEDLPWWEKRAGMFADDPIYDEAMRLGREWRESQREDYDHD